MRNAAQGSPQQQFLVMGVGNTLLQDDGIGIHVTEFLRETELAEAGLDIVDGGTIGLALLPQLEAADAVIIVDAAEMGAAPGEMRVFLDQEVDRHLSGKRRSVHEVAVLDLLAAAELRGRRPAHCALVAIQPASTDWGLEPTRDVQAAIPVACETIQSITRSWRHEA